MNYLKLKSVCRFGSTRIRSDGMSSTYANLDPFRCEFEPMIPILEQTELENRRYRQEQAEWRESYQAKLNKEIARIDRELGVDHGR